METINKTNSNSLKEYQVLQIGKEMKSWKIKMECQLAA